MKHSEHSSEESAEWASLFVAGSMTPVERAEFEGHLKTGCPQCKSELEQLDGVAATLLSAATSHSLPNSARASLMARVESSSRGHSHADVGPQVWKNWGADEPEIGEVIRQAAGDAWEDTGVRGVQVRRLFVDAAHNRMTALVRMAAGSSYPAHVHVGPEECYVLQGDLRAGGQILHAGDYERLAVGTKHRVQSTEKGCLLLIVSSLSDKLV